MNKITQQTVLNLINNINSFAEQSDQKIQLLWNNFNNSKSRLEEQYNSFMKKASAEYDNKTAAVRKKATDLKESAEKIYHEVLSLDMSLANADKYYVKTKIKKEKELSEKTQKSITDDANIFNALSKVKEKFEVLSDKYSKDKLPALFDSINFLFSEKRKQDYEELIVLKNTLERLMEEIKKTIPELISDSTKSDTESHNKRISEIKTKYQSELSSVKSRYEKDVEILAADICEKLDAVLPDSLLCLLKEINECYLKTFSSMTLNRNAWDGSIVIGYIDYPSGIICKF